MKTIDEYFHQETGIQAALVRFKANPYSHMGLETYFEE